MGFVATSMETSTNVMHTFIDEEIRHGDNEDCEEMEEKKNSALLPSVSEPENCDNGCPLPNGMYQESSSGSRLFFWFGEKKEDGCFSNIDVSPFTKLHEHVRLDNLYMSSGDGISFNVDDGVGRRFGTFLASGHLPSQRSVLLVHAGGELVMVPHQCMNDRTGDKLSRKSAHDLLEADLKTLRQKQQSESLEKFLYLV